MNSLIYRQNKLFKIDINQLPMSARNTDTMNEMYLYLHFEFRGASENPKYSKMTYQERMEVINQYARKWLTIKGHK